MTTRQHTLYSISKDEGVWVVKSSRNGWKPIKHPVFKNYLEARNWVIDTKLSGNVARAQLDIVAA